MKAELIDVSETKKNLDIEIPQDVIDQEILQIAQGFARKAKVPGFRPGKAPVHVVKTRFRDEIVSEMLQHLLPKYFTDAVEERKLEVVQTPNFEQIDYNSGQPLRFKAVFEVYPQISIDNYVGVPVEDIPVTVEDSEVEKSLSKLQEDAAEIVPMEDERPIRNGDFAEISFEGTIQGIDEPPIAAERVMCEVGAATTLKEFTENLIGAIPGDQKTFSVTYRAEYPEKRLAGKTVDYKITVEGVKEKKLPTIDDELAQGYGDYKTLDELKSKIRSDIESHKRGHANEKMRDKLLEWLEDHNEFEVPETLVERQLETRLQRLLRDLSRQGINPQHLDVDWRKIREEQRVQSARDVRGSLILDYIREKENIDVDDAEVDAEIEAIARETQKPSEKVREVLTRGDSGLARLQEQIRNKKTLDFLQEKAEIQPASQIVNP